MKNLKTVFQFELAEMAKKRTIIVTSLILALVVFAVTFIPRFAFNDNNDTPQTSNNFKEAVLYTADSELRDLFSGIENLKLSTSAEAVRQSVEDGSAKNGFIVDTPTSYTLVAKDTGMMNQDQMVFEEILKTFATNANLKEAGINPEDVYNASNVTIERTVERLGKDASQGYAFAFVALFVMYMLILLYGQSVATSVAREKDSRTMELLITSTKPKVLILGKVFAVGLMGILQIAVLILAFVLGFMINKATYPDFILTMIQSTISLDVALIYALFSMTGYLLYLFIFAALGSLVSKVEDVSSAVTPITFLFVFAYMIATIGMQMPDSFIVKVSSYIPFVSMFTMPIRYMLTSVSALEIIISMAIMIAVIVVIARLSIYIYRKGSLNYGNRMKLLDVLRSSRKNT